MELRQTKFNPLPYLFEQPFIIESITVYGYNYSIESENKNPKPHWNIEIDNPGQPIIEHIQTENIFVFKSNTSTLLILSSGIPHSLSLFINPVNLDTLVNIRNRKGKLISELKYEIHKNWA